MKKLYTLVVASLLSMSTFAQAPEMMSYQAVVRDAADNLIASSPVGMQISILQGSPSGTAAYVETHTPTSNQNGLVSIEIGNGTIVSGDFATIDWANGPYYVKTETDPTGGTSYTITGTSQLLSVPYALYAKNTAAWQTYNDTTYTLNTVGVGVNSPVANFHLQNGGFSDLLIESTGSVEDASLWLKNPSKSWRLHGDQNDDNKFKIGLWTDYSEIGGSNLLQYSMTIDTLGNVGIGTPNPGVKLDVIGDMRISLGNALRLGGVSSNNNSQYTMHVPNFPGAPTRVSMPFDAGTNRHFEVGYYTNNDENDTWNETLDVNPAKQKVTFTDVMNITPRATAPANPSKGDIYMDDTTNKLMVYDGTTWQACW
jgi:hypothetical protein